VHYDVIVAAQNAGILPLTPHGVIESEFYSSFPPSLDVKALFEELGRVCKVPTSLFSAPTRTRRLIHVPQKLNL
jgi:hypothetical protein